MHYFLVILNVNECLALGIKTKIYLDILQVSNISGQANNSE
jgi:hypothetical protein